MIKRKKWKFSTVRDFWEKFQVQEKNHVRVHFHSSFLYKYNEFCVEFNISKAVVAVIYAGFSVEGGPQNIWGSDFSRVERNFTIGQGPKVLGNFSKICIKIN